MKNNKFVRLTESAVMLALATVLSILKLIDLPYGGSITVCSMLPVILIAYRYGAGWGLCTSAAYAMIQLLIGSSVLSYATSAWAVVCIIILDYLVAFGVLCIAGFFRKSAISQSKALAVSVTISSLLRYLCHVVSGYVVWRDISIPGNDAWIYSFGYNASYMVPEFIVTVIGALYISKVLDFRSENITRAYAPTKKLSATAVLINIVSKTSVAVGAVWAIFILAPSIQDETGFISVANIPAQSWIYAGIVLVSATAVSMILHLIFKRTVSHQP